MGKGEDKIMMMKKYLQIGKKYYWKRAGIITKTIHILAEVEEHVVYRWWKKSKLCWVWSIDSRYFLDMLVERGDITTIKGKKICALN